MTKPPGERVTMKIGQSMVSGDRETLERLRADVEASEARAKEQAAAPPPPPPMVRPPLRYDVETGELLDDPAPVASGESETAPRARAKWSEKKPRRRELTPEELAVRDERLALKRAMRTALETLSPALVVEGDPPLRDSPLIDVSHARMVRPLLELPRMSGRGQPGSALVASSRVYDGSNGGEAGAYVLLCVRFHDGHGFKCRSRGTVIRRDELRAVAWVLLAEADRDDAERADVDGEDDAP